MKKSADIIAFCNTLLRVPEGRHVGRPMKLRPWQEQIIRDIYDNPAGTRRALISFGRKNGKSTLTAMLLLVHLCCEGVAKSNSQIFSTALSREQASIIFGLACKMIRMSPELNALVTIRESRKELYFARLGTTYRALSADACTAFGLSPAFVIHDELGLVRGPRSELFEALETGSGAQESPLTIVISTQAATDADLLSILIDDALAGHDPRVVLSLHTAPADLDTFSEEAIRAANPAFGDFLNPDEALAMCEDARRMPARQAEYENRILNRRGDPSSSFVSHDAWQLCAAEPKPLTGIPVYGGLDLSAVADLTALVLTGDVDAVWQVEPSFWLPAHGLAEKAANDHVPYDVWARQGHLLTCPGKSISYDFVAVHLYETFQRYDIRKIAFDRWGFKHLHPCLVRAGFTERFIDEHFVEFGQGLQSMSPALRALESAILDARIAHGGHPVLEMCATNCVVEICDAAGNKKLTKKKSTGRIDGMVALTMAMGVAPLHVEAKEIVFDDTIDHVGTPLAVTQLTYW